MQDPIIAVGSTEKLSVSAKKNIIDWLTGEKYSHYKDELTGLVVNEDWQLLEDNFYTILPFGTGGRRGTVGIGSARVNRITIGETVQALCDYLHEVYAEDDITGVAIACDSRLTSEEFSKYCAEVLAGNNIKAYIFNGPRATPELSFAVRHLDMTAGIVITASHNPSSDNGIKLYWKDGGQLVSPHDGNILGAAERGTHIAKVAYEKGRNEGLIHVIHTDVDAAYFKTVLKESRSKNHDLKIAYSPLHGTGITSVYPVLQKVGFNVVLYESQATLDGNFANVTNNIPNPEVVTTNDKVSAYALEQDADIAITNDPDADRYCIIVNHNGHMQQLNGNQAAVLMTDYILEKAKNTNSLTSKHFISSTIVTTDLLPLLAKHYGINSVSNLLVGFKYIGEQIHLRCDKGDEIFLCGGEESYGGIIGTYARDKDGAAPAMILAEMAAELKVKKVTLVDKLDELYSKHGYFHEELEAIYFYGASGSEKMKAFMHDLRSNPPKEMAGCKVRKVRDYITGEEIEGRSEDVLRIEFSNDGRNRITVRPSGTEPKLKVYVQMYAPVVDSLAATKESVISKANALKQDILCMVTNYSE